MQGARCKEPGARSQEPGARSKKLAVRRRSNTRWKKAKPKPTNAHTTLYCCLRRAAQRELRLDLSARPLLLELA